MAAAGQERAPQADLARRGGAPAGQAAVAPCPPRRHRDIIIITTTTTTTIVVVVVVVIIIVIQYWPSCNPSIVE